MVQWVNRSLIQAPRNGTTSHTVSFTAAASGNLLVAVAEGAVTSTTPTGWTLPAGGSAVNNTGLYVWYKTATAAESSFTTTHNAANYPAGFVVYEFAAGSTFVASVAGTAIDATAGANPNLTGLTGTNLLFGAIGVGSSTGTPAMSCAWSGTGSPVEDVDQDVQYGVGPTDGYELSLAYVESSAATSFQPTGAVTGATASKEALTFAVKVAAAGSSFSGSVALAGAGSLTGAGKPAVSGPVALAGSGALTSAGKPSTSGSTAPAGAGTLALSGVPNPSGSLALGGSGSLTFTSGTGYTGTLALAGSGGLALSGNATGTASGTLNTTGAGTLTLSGKITATGALTLAGLGTLTAAGQPATGATLALTGAGSLTLSGVPLGLATDITVTGTLDPRHWAVTLLPGTKTATLEPRRWDGSL